MSGIIASAALIAALCQASWNAMLRAGTDRFAIRSAMVVFSGVACLVFLPFLKPISPEVLKFLCISAVLHLGYNTLLVVMYREGDLGHAFVICQGVQPVLVTLGGWVFARDEVTGVSLLGVFLVSAGVFVLWARGKINRTSMLCAFAIGLIGSAYSVTDGLGVRAAGGALNYAPWIVIANAVPMLAVFYSMRPDVRKWTLNLRDSVIAFVGGSIALGGYGLMLWAMQSAPFGELAALNKTNIIFASLLGWFFLGEGFSGRKIAAAIVIAGGAALVCLF
jgi:drug/metabolite transporter (DMT)-like permease